MTSPTIRPPGLCEGCSHRRIVTTPRSAFLLCERSKNDPAYPRYPRLPVLVCPGFEPGEPTKTPATGDPDRGSQG